MVAVEAMAAGKPVLASQKGGISEFVLEGITGYHLAEPMTSESILADIKRVLADADRAQIAKMPEILFSQNIAGNMLLSVLKHKYKTGLVKNYWI